MRGAGKDMRNEREIPRLGVGSQPIVMPSEEPGKSNGRNQMPSTLGRVSSSKIARVAAQEERVTTSTGYAPSSADVISPSMSLIDESAQCMFDVMGALKHSAKAGDIEAVHAACACAKQVKELMRLKLDVLKYEEGRV